MGWVSIIQERACCGWGPSPEARGGSGQADALGSGTQWHPELPTRQGLHSTWVSSAVAVEGVGASVTWSRDTAHQISPDTGLCGW